MINNGESFMGYDEIESRLCWNLESCMHEVPEHIAQGTADEIRLALANVTRTLMKKFPIGSRVQLFADNPNEQNIADITKYVKDVTGIYTSVRARYLASGKTGELKIKYLENASLIKGEVNEEAQHFAKIETRIKPAIRPWILTVPRPIDLDKEIDVITKKIMAKVRSKKKNAVANLNDITDSEILEYAKKFIGDKYSYWE